MTAPVRHPRISPGGIGSGIRNVVPPGGITGDVLCEASATVALLAPPSRADWCALPPQPVERIAGTSGIRGGKDGVATSRKLGD